MAVAQVLARLRREPFADLPIAEHLDQVCRACGHVWRQRLLSPMLTLRLFMLQVLHGNTAITHLRQLSGLAFAPASYCEARARLPLEVFTSLLGAVVQWAQRAAQPAARALGQRVFIVDNSNFSMSDEPELRAHFHLPPGTKAGIGYPLATVMGLLDAASGLFVQMLCLPLFVHEMRAVIHLHDALQSGDILLGDRAFCSFVHLVLLNARGVFVCFRLHQKRKGQRGSGIERWQRPKQRPVWMSDDQFRALPSCIDVRLVSYRVQHKGFRTKQVTVATTLLDASAWPEARVAALYGERWHIERCFNHLKTTMKMNVLRCKTLDGVLKELAIYLLIYNLVRLAMLRAASEQQVSSARISFVDALRQLCCQMLGLSGIATLIVNPQRPGRCEPRVLRRRIKPYDLLTRPRAELKRAMKSQSNG